MLTDFAPAISQGGLRSRLDQTRSRMSGVKSQLRHVKAEQATARNKLTASQRELASAAARLHTAEGRLGQTRGTLRQVKAEHTATKARLAKHSTMMEQRVLALYRNEQPSYLEVMLNATDFEDFTNRAEFSARIAGQDQTVLTDLADAKRELESQTLVLRDKEVEQANLVREVETQKREVAVRTEEAHQILAKTTSDRAEYEKQLTALEQDSKDIESMISRVQRGEEGARYTGTWSGHFLRPVPGPVTSPFGWRIHPILGTRRFHNGVDLGAAYGTPIHAADKGTVVHAGWWGAYGQAVILDHGSGMSTLYGHMSSVACSEGQTVRRGQVIGYVGATGWATGPHLHFSVFKDGQAVNPLGF
jgi:murein DD-endopeptidase MepM/ murein hydrolase activator NlpD